MALKGRAFLAIWHDIAESAEAEYNAWHTRQHMPERLGVPGFLVGRRYVDWSLTDQRYFTLYEAATLETFGSDAYRARLNNPTAWSARVQPHFLNFGRSACVLSASIGRGIGGAIATTRLYFRERRTDAFEAAAEKLACSLVALDGVTGAHLGMAAEKVTRVRTRESELRAQTGEDVFDAVLMVEGIGRREIESAMPAIRSQLGQAVRFEADRSAVYDLAYMLIAEDVA